MAKDATLESISQEIGQARFGPLLPGSPGCWRVRQTPASEAVIDVRRHDTVTVRARDSTAGTPRDGDVDNNITHAQTEQDVNVGSDGNNADDGPSEMGNARAGFNEDEGGAVVKETWVEVRQSLHWSANLLPAPLWDEGVGDFNAVGAALCQALAGEEAAIACDIQVLISALLLSSNQRK